MVVTGKLGISRNLIKLVYDWEYQDDSFLNTTLFYDWEYQDDSFLNTTLFYDWEYQDDSFLNTALFYDWEYQDDSFLNTALFYDWEYHLRRMIPFLTLPYFMTENTISEGWFLS